MNRARRMVLGALLVLACPAAAGAQQEEPEIAPVPAWYSGRRSLWVYAQQPQLREAERALLEGQRHRLLAGQHRRFPELFEADLAHAEAAYIRATQLAPAWVETWFALAELLDARGLNAERYGHAAAAQRDFARAAVAIERAWRLVDDGSEAADVLSLASVLMTRVGRFDEARAAYEQLLRLPLERPARGVALCNLAETHVYLGDLARAIETYRACIDTVPELGTGWWGLASAYDRDGREADARYAAQQALLADPELRELLGPSVFFTPEYERHYYLGLAREAQGDRAGALNEWRAYVRRSAPGDRWVARARAHVARLEAATDSEQHATARSPRRRASPRPRGNARGTSRPGGPRR